MWLVNKAAQLTGQLTTRLWRRKLVPRSGYCGVIFLKGIIVSDEITETAMATQEVAKAASKALEVSEKLGTFVAKVLGEPGVFQASCHCFPFKPRFASVAQFFSPGST